MTTPSIWVEGAMPSGAAIEYVLLIRQILEKPVGLVALPLPGREEYLAALDDAVAAAVRGDLSPHEALHQAAVKWEEITERLGRQRQLAAFRRSLGLH
jgi:multiple sugar transport system substrate-binding protein